MTGHQYSAMKYALSLSALLLCLSCSKSGGNTPVQPPPKDTTVTTPPADTTHTGTTGTGTDTSMHGGTHNKTFFVMNVADGLVIRGNNGVYVEEFSDGGGGVNDLTNHIRTNTSGGNSLTQRFINPCNQLPVLTIDQGADQAQADYPNSTIYKYDQEEPISDTAKYLNFQFTEGDTTYVVFPPPTMILRGFLGTPSQCDSVLRVIGSTPTAPEGNIAHIW